MRKTKSPCIDKLNEYLESIREIETRLAKENQWLTVRPAKQLAKPGKGMSGEQEMRLMYDLMVMAFQRGGQKKTPYDNECQRASCRRGDRTPVKLFLAGLTEWNGTAINRAAGVQK